MNYVGNIHIALPHPFDSKDDGSLKQIVGVGDYNRQSRHYILPAS